MIQLRLGYLFCATLVLLPLTSGRVLAEDDLEGTPRIADASTDDGLPEVERSAPLDEGPLPEEPEAEVVPGPVTTPTEDCPSPSRLTIRKLPKQSDLLQTYVALEPSRPKCIAPPRHADLFPWSNPPVYGRYVFLHHDPLLFEDIPAERYGEAHHPCVQPVVSLTKFAGTLPMLTYKVTVNQLAARNEGAYYDYDHHYNLRPGAVEGYYFPHLYVGAPYPQSRGRALLTTAGVVAGVILFIP